MIQSAIQDMLLPSVTGWLAKIALAKQSRKGFDAVASQCRAFYSAAAGFFWESDYQKNYLKGSLEPKFKITIAKAFEMVAIMGPSLYWQNPQRRVRTRRQWRADPGYLQHRFTRQVPPEQQQMLGQQLEQLIQQQVQQVMQQENVRKSESDLRCSLVEQWLNYTPTEQPEGGLELHAERAITEALVTGRGCLWVEPYKMPGSDLKLVGSFYDTNNNLLNDPDATNIQSPTCTWIARRCLHPAWYVERKYNLPRGSLKGHLESGNSIGERTTDHSADMKRSGGKTNDLVEYYKIYSKAGIGCRMTGMEQDDKESLDDFFGDYCHLVVSPGCDFFLNAHPDSFISEGEPIGDKEVRDKFRWPVPFWLDNRWPVAELDFYSKCEDRDKPDAWPIAPLSPGIGELTAINIMVSHLVNRTWESSRTLVAVLESAADEVQAWLKSGNDQQTIRIKDIHKDIQQVVSFLKQPDVNIDAWKALEMLFDIFDKRVGLSEILYGMQTTQSRSATDIKIRESKAGIRPDYMAKKVDSWMKVVADMEKIATYFSGVSGGDVFHLVGPVGAELWDELVANADPELVLREMYATTEANSSRKRNAQMDAENMNTVTPVMLPLLNEYATATGNTEPFMQMANKWLETMDFDMQLSLGPKTPPPPPPEAMQAQQAMQQAQVAKVQADTALAQSKAQESGAKARREMTPEMPDPLEGEIARQKLLAGFEDMQMKREKHRQGMQHADMGAIASLLSAGAA